MPGAKSLKEVEIIEYSMGALIPLEIDYSTYIDAGKKRQILFSKRITIPLTDILISELTIKNNLHLITYDKHFLEFKKSIWFKPDISRKIKVKTANDKIK